MTDQPMTPERLAEIRGHYTQGPGLVDPEVERLIAEVRRLQEQLRLANIDAFDNGNHAEELEAEVERLRGRVFDILSTTEHAANRRSGETLEQSMRRALLAVQEIAREESPNG